MSTASLSALGFTPFFRAALAALEDPTLVPARVSNVQRGAYTVWAADGPCPAHLPGRLLHAAHDARDLPTVGDWVALAPPPAVGAPATIAALLPRQGALVRQAAGRAAAPQLLAANVDRVYVVTTPGGDFSASRLARYRATIAPSGAEPVVLLNKADLSSAEATEARLAEIPRGMRALVTSAHEGTGLAALLAELDPGLTVALIGSSGVGKSTLANRLLGAEALATLPVRAHDETGRHTTTGRTLVPLPTGALLIDTPGLRELALWADADPRLAADDPIAALAARCRFADCSHGGEPGCAVREAVETGALDARALAEQEALEREAAWQRRRLEPGAERDRGRAFARLVREAEALARNRRR